MRYVDKSATWSLGWRFVSEIWPVVGIGLTSGIIEMYLHKDYPEAGIIHPQKTD